MGSSTNRRPSWGLLQIEYLHKVFNSQRTSWVLPRVFYENLTFQWFSNDRGYFWHLLQILDIPGALYRKNICLRSSIDRFSRKRRPSLVPQRESHLRPATESSPAFLCSSNIRSSRGLLQKKSFVKFYPEKKISFGLL